MTRTARVLVSSTYLVAVFLGAFLLFLVEPMVAKMLLPTLGGSPAVWNTAMVFFQGVLLAGYAWAHATLDHLPPGRQSILQIALLLAVALVLPVAIPAGWRPPTGGDPVWWTLGVLAVMVGAPFFALATVGPTLQRWFSLTTHPRARDPYFLYAAGNVGSLLGLLAYPFLLEPRLDLVDQSRLWGWLYLAFAIAAAACVLELRRFRAGEWSRARSGARPLRLPMATRLRWAYLAAIPSALLLGVTRHIATDVASVPLLWVVPLSLYLATFIVAFGRGTTRVIRASALAFRVLAVPMALGFFGIVPSLWLELPIQLIGFTSAALVAHGRLASERPEPSGLTGFFLMIAAGGVVGGIAAALVAPIVFTSVLEYPIAIALALTVLPPREVIADRPSGRSRTWTALMGVASASLGVGALIVRSLGTQRALTVAMLVAAVPLLGAYAMARTTRAYAAVVGGIMLAAAVLPSNPTLFADRTFFGVYRVELLSSGAHVLLNGTTVHGVEDVNDSGGLEDVPRAYYDATGPIGDVFRFLATRPATRIGVIGAGAGALAAYTRPADALTFYEIDPAVARIATDQALFTFVADARGSVRFEIGDGRIRLQQDAHARYDLLVVDAFSSDAIPTHLLTDEAVRLYVDRLADGGLLAFNVSNRYFDLAPVLARIAAEDGLSARERDDTSVTPEEAASGKLASDWVVLARRDSDLSGLAAMAGWRSVGSGGGAPLWTDTYTDLLGTLR